MCAIVGLIRKPDKNNILGKPQIELAKDMLNSMLHRGPDSTEIFECRQNIVLGHNRLAIIGLDDGKQPISNGRTSIVVNGEFYGYEKLKRDLFPDYPWKTSSDSEILIPLYEKFGIEKALEYLDGEFAFILHDNQENIIYAARDRFGVKPLAYRESFAGIELASEVRAFQGEKSWNLNALCTGLAMHYQNLRDTIAAGIYNVLPGHYLKIDSRQGVILEEKRWWELSWPLFKRLNINEYEAALTFRELFSKSVKNRLRSDAKLCVALSGGIDSSSVLGMAARCMDRVPESFTVSFPDAGEMAYNELAIAKRTAAYIGSKLHEVEMPATKILELLPDAISTGEGFAVNGHISCKYALAKAVHNAGFKVMLVGEGADECLLGYSHLKVDQFGISSANSLMNGTETQVGDLLMEEKFKELPYLPSFLKAKLSSGARIASMLTNEFRHEIFDGHALANQQETLATFMTIASNKLEKSMGAWLATAFPTYICKVLGDSQEMHSSVEARLPFLDRELFAFVSTLQNRLKSTYYNEKKVLRDAVVGLVPNEVISRPKQPFQAPPLSFLLSKKDWNEKFVDLCISNSVIAEIFDRQTLENYLLTIKDKTLEEQIVDEPVTMLIASAAVLSNNLKI